MRISIQPAADGRLSAAISARLRARRFGLFERLAASLPRPLEILDVGGTPDFWQRHGWAGRADVRLTLLNLRPQPSTQANMHCLEGDATDLGRFGDRSFDIAFSNSVIEHLYTATRQRQMASEVRRVAGACWVQTPNFWFPIEPHFYLPAWHWLPAPVRIALVRRFRCGCRGPCPDRAHARRVVKEIRLLRRRDLQAIFPGASIIGERVGGLVKSWIVHDGFDAPAASLHRAA
ncbi:MAG: class I SAM-dependent methyltransferase [Planctomycetota bacterium]|jgi:hypothetical protein